MPVPARTKCLSAAARLLKLWVRIPPLYVVRYRPVRRADHSFTGVLLSVRVSECDGDASVLRRPWPTGGLLSHKKVLIK